MLYCSFFELPFAISVLLLNNNFGYQVAIIDGYMDESDSGLKIQKTYTKLKSILYEINIDKVSGTLPNWFLISIAATMPGQ